MMEITALVSQVSEWLGVTAVAMLAGISPRFKRRPLAFVYPRRELLLSFLLFLLILALAFGLYFAGGFQSGLLFSRLGLAVMALVPFAGALLVRRQPVRSAGWGLQTLRPALLLGLGLAVLSLFLRGKVFTLINIATSETWLVLLFWLGIALAEETVFRGYIQLRLVAVRGPVLGVLATAAMFAVWKLPLLLLAANVLPTTVLMGLALAFVQGLVLGYLMLKSGNVAAPILYRAISEWVLYL